MGKSKECMDTVSDNNLLVSDLTAVFGHYIKYYVNSEVRSMHLRSCCDTCCFGILPCLAAILHFGKPVTKPPLA